MERVRFIEYLGTQILLIDCSQCGPQELSRVFNEAQQVITSQPPHSLLTLADFSDAEFDKRAADHMKVVATYDRAFVKRSAIVGGYAARRLLPEPGLFFGALLSGVQNARRSHGLAD